MSIESACIIYRNLGKLVLLTKDLSVMIPYLLIWLP